MKKFDLSKMDTMYLYNIERILNKTIDLIFQYGVESLELKDQKIPCEKHPRGICYWIHIAEIETFQYYGSNKNVIMNMLKAYLPLFRRLILCNLQKYWFYNIRRYRVTTFKFYTPRLKLLFKLHKEIHEELLKR